MKNHEVFKLDKISFVSLRALRGVHSTWILDVLNYIPNQPSVKYNSKRQIGFVSLSGL